MSSMEDWTMMRPPDVGRLSTIGPRRTSALPFGMFGPRLCGFGPVGIFAMRRNWGHNAQASFSSRSRAQNHWSCQWKCTAFLRRPGIGLPNSSLKFQSSRRHSTDSAHYVYHNSAHIFCAFHFLSTSKQHVCIFHSTYHFRSEVRPK